MPNYRRDAALATLSLAALVSVLAWQGQVAALLAPRAVVVGVGGALTVEAAFLTVPAVARAWERPAVQVGGLIAVVVGGLVALARWGPPAVAAVCWGLVTYFAVLAVVLGRS